MKTSIICTWRARIFRTPLALWLGAILLVGGGCQKFGVEPEGPVAAPNAAEIKLAAGKNPFSMAIMLQAYANITKPKPTGAVPQVGAFNASGAQLNAGSAAVINAETSAECLGCPAAMVASSPSPTGPVQPTHEYVRFKAANTD